MKDIDLSGKILKMIFEIEWEINQVFLKCADHYLTSKISELVY